MRTSITAIGALLLLFAATLVLAQNGNALFQEALVKERVDGDMQGAIRIYERIVKEFPSNREVTAKALLQLGLCLEKLGEQSKARDYFQQVISKYSEQRDAVAEARKHLLSSLPSRIEVKTLPGDPFDFAISPNGRDIVFSGALDTKSQLWVRSLDTGKTTPISGTDNGFGAFWSPDGQSIGFFVDGKLKRIPLTGGVAATLADAPTPTGGTWNKDGVILFSPHVRGSLYRVSEKGGDPMEVTRLGTDRGHRYPHFLPDGKHFLLWRLSTGRLALGSLDSADVKAIDNAAQSGVFLPPDQILFAQSEALYVGRLDVRTGEILASTRVSDRVAATRTGTMAISASASGSIAYRTDSVGLRQFVWLDRQGRQTGVLLRPERLSPCCLRFSPDGRNIVFWRGTPDPLAGRAYFIDASTSRVTALNDGSMMPIWAADGETITAVRYPEGSLDTQLVRESLKRGERGTVLLRTRDIKAPSDWSPDGRFLLYTNTTTSTDLLALPAAGGDPIVVANTAAVEFAGRFSPNGKWIAYASTEIGGRPEVFLQPFPGSIVSRRRISIAGGREPQWKADGRELYFISPGNQLMVVSISFSPDGSSFELGAPVPLFPSPLPGTEYAISPDGQRIAVNVATEDVPPIIVLSNWPGAKR